MSLAFKNDSSLPEVGAFPGYEQGSNLLNTEVEILYEYMCPGSKYYFARIGKDEDTGYEGTNIIDVLNDN